MLRAYCPNIYNLLIRYAWLRVWPFQQWPISIRAQLGISPTYFTAPFFLVWLYLLPKIISSWATLWYEMHSEVAPVYIACVLQWTGVLLFHSSACCSGNSEDRKILRSIVNSACCTCVACKSLQLFMCWSHSRGIHSTGELCWLNTYVLRNYANTHSEIF